MRLRLFPHPVPIYICLPYMRTLQFVCICNINAHIPNILHQTDMKTSRSQNFNPWLEVVASLFHAPLRRAYISPRSVLPLRVCNPGGLSSACNQNSERLHPSKSPTLKRGSQRVHAQKDKGPGIDRRTIIYLSHYHSKPV